MNTIKTFENLELGASIRVMTQENGELWFVGKDVAEALGYSNPQKAIRDHVKDKHKSNRTIRSVASKNASVTVLINEAGLYSLVLASKLPQAEVFQDWVTEVVLPQIRKTGGYIPVQQEDDEKMILCKALAIFKRTVEQKDALLEAQKPLVHFAEAVTESEGSILIGELAKLLTKNGYKIGRQRLFQKLREMGYLFKQSTEPIQKWVERGLFELSVSLISTNHGDIERVTTRVTGKGQQYFINLFCK